MKTELYKSDTVKCSLISPFHKITEIDNFSKTISVGEGLQKISWLIEGDAYLVWPNREGEGFTLSHAVKKLTTLEHAHKGVSISYPATASIMAFLIRTEEGKTVLIYMDRDEKGRICNINLCRKNAKALSIDITAKHKSWRWILVSEEARLNDYLCHSEKKHSKLKRQFQLGFIGPSGQCNIPENIGFDVIPQIADLIKENFNPATSCIHLFGYAKGHDILYPDYSPSEMLGGERLLKSAIKKTKELGFKISFYLNGRIIDSEALVQFPSLKKSLLRDNQGNLIKETYQNRIFYVVNPSSSDWENCLLDWAHQLSDYGADTLQLDQLGGRAAVKERGEIWGEGYNRIIDRIHKLGMKVWIQGVSDYYRADRFEMTVRDLKILEDGTLRGGNPFGETDLSLIKLFLKNRTFLATKSKIDTIKESGKYNFIIDYPDYRGELPLYNAQYITSITNAKAALQ